MTIRVRAASYEQVAGIRDDVDVIVPLDIWNGRGYAELPRFCPQPLAIPKNLTKIVAENIGHIEFAQRHGLSARGGHFLNITNSVAAAEYLKTLEDITLSVELNARKIEKIPGKTGIIGYGYLPLMTLRCPPPIGELRDRRNAVFKLQKTKNYTQLLNSVPLYVCDEAEKFPTADFMTLYFTTESAARCAEIYSRAKNREPIGTDRTRGLYFKKVE